MNPIGLFTATALATQFGAWTPPTGLPPDMPLEFALVPAGLPWVVGLTAAAALAWVCIQFARRFRQQAARSLAALGSSSQAQEHPLGGRSLPGQGAIST